MFIGIVVALMVLLADQVSKYWVLEHLLGAYTHIEVTSFFNIVNAWNTGVSFSMFTASSIWGMLFLVVMASVIVIFLLWWLYFEKVLFNQLALGMIIGGAVGNIVDRVRLGAVFDFLDVYYGSYHWPAFNVADSFICVGACMMIGYTIFEKKEKK